MKLNPNFLPIKKQVLMLFVVFAVILVGFVLFNYYSFKNYNNSIRNIKDSVIRKLTLIGGISLNTGINQSNIFLYLYSSNPDERILYSKKIMEKIEQTNVFLNNLIELVKVDETHENLEIVLKIRLKYIDKVREIIEETGSQKDFESFNAQESEIIFFYEEFFQALQNLSVMVINEADDETTKALEKISRVKVFSHLLIAIGIIILLFNSFFISRIYRHLSLDYQRLTDEETGKIKAQRELEELNLQLEEKITGRTVELEDANREISTYNTELKKLSEEKDKFISVISHDLRNPISTILASSDAMAKNEDKKELHQFAKIINRASVKVMTQLNELVDWAKTRNIHKVFKPVKLNLWEAVNESLQLIEAFAEQNSVKLENKISSSIYIKADSIMFRSIIQNLVTNSIKFTPALGSVTIDALEKGEMVEISIKDQGLGMTDEVKEGLFKESLGEEKSKEAGIGLALVKDFIAKHEGTIAVESELGKGSLFVFTIPRA